MPWPNDRIVTITPGAPIPANLLNELQDTTKRHKHGDIARIWPIHGNYQSTEGTWETDRNGNVQTLTVADAIRVPLLGLGTDDLLVKLVVRGSIGDPSSTFEVKLITSPTNAFADDGTGTGAAELVVNTLSSGTTAGIVTVTFDATTSPSTFPRRLKDLERMALLITATGTGSMRRTVDRYQTIIRRDL